MREANDRGYECLVLSDCVGSYFPEFQRVALAMISAQGGIFGWVAPSSAYLSALAATDSRHHRLTRPRPTDVVGAPMSVLNRPSRSPPRPNSASPGGHQVTTNAAFGLGFNVLVNVLVLSALCIGVIGLSSDNVYGTIVPALGIQLLIGNVYYTYLARRLARRENRDTVTAMPYGPSVPHMFIVTFLIMLPIYLTTKDAIRAWQTGLAWAFIIGIIVVIGAFVGPYVRRYTPRAAMLGHARGHLA